ncbi:MAG: aminopeptidase [Gammaproteobacteria bacterium]|nr:aminopeptidase [Gammaproteobacteria bacterium]
MLRRTRWLCVALAAVVLLAGLSGCASVRFYAQAVAGQATLMLARRDTGAVLADPATAPDVALKLRLVARLLRFAEVELELPVGGRYGSFVESDGVVLWNVVAAPEFDVAAVPRCYPIVGCAVYRGFFAREAAEREAARLGVDHDVHIAPVAAYSTLGWFDDPILSSFLHYDEASLAELIFHELAHSVVYVRGDSAFNESFATFVGSQGAMAWLLHNDVDTGPYTAALAARNAFRDFLGLWRERLATLYARPIADDAKRQLKAAAFAAMGVCYGRHRARLGDGRYDNAMSTPYNNARLALAAAYDDLKPAFAGLYLDAGDWPAFYAEVGKIASLSMSERREVLAQWSRSADTAPTGFTCETHGVPSDRCPMRL